MNWNYIVLFDIPEKHFLKWINNIGNRSLSDSGQIAEPKDDKSRFVKEVKEY